MSYRFEKLADKWLVVKLRGGQEFMCECPKHEDLSPSLQFNVDKGLFVCFSCGWKGTARKLVQELGGQYSEPEIQRENLLRKISESLARGYSMSAVKETEPRRNESILRRSQLIKTPYWQRRGFSEQTVKEWELGYDVMSASATIPLYTFEKELIGLILRSTDPDFFPKYKYPKGFKKTHHFFGEHRLAENSPSSEPYSGGNRAILIEGATDAMSVWQALRESQEDEVGYFELGQYGAEISDFQVGLLKRYDIREIVEFYDYDEAGIKSGRITRQKVHDIIIRRVRYDKEKYCWRNPFRSDRNPKPCKCSRKHRPDPGMLKPAEIQEMIANARFVI